MVIASDISSLTVLFYLSCYRRDLPCDTYLTILDMLLKKSLLAWANCFDRRHKYKGGTKLLIKQTFNQLWKV